MTQENSQPEIDTDPEAAKPGSCKSIHHAILAVRQNVAYIQKKKTQQLNYTIVGIEEVIKECRPFMNLYGVMIYPQSQSVANETVFKTAKGSEMREVVVACSWKLVHADSGTEIDIQTIGQAADTGDKAVPKANTAAFKEALRRIFVIESGDMDPDQYASQSRAVTERGNGRSINFDAAEKALAAARDEGQLAHYWGKVEQKFGDEEKKLLWETHQKRQSQLRGGSNGQQPKQAPSRNGNGRQVAAR